MAAYRASRTDITRSDPPGGQTPLDRAGRIAGRNRRIGGDPEHQATYPRMTSDIQGRDREQREPAAVGETSGPPENLRSREQGRLGSADRSFGSDVPGSSTRRGFVAQGRVRRTS